MGALTWNSEYNAIEIEYMLLPRYWHQGHGTGLVRLLLQMAGKARQGQDTIAITDPENTFSKRLLQHAGFRLVRQYVNDDGEPAELYIKETERAGEHENRH